MNVAAALAFLGFLGMLARVRRAATRGPDARRAAVSGLIGYCIAVSFAAGLSQRDA